jgi:hypothetical protein
MQMLSSVEFLGTLAKAWWGVGRLFSLFEVNCNFRRAFDMFGRERDAISMIHQENKWGILMRFVWKGVKCPKTLSKLVCKLDEASRPGYIAL